MGVFLTYATAQGRVLLDRELYLPQVWASSRTISPHINQNPHSSSNVTSD